jgi:DNA polymerase III beta subunit
VFCIYDLEGVLREQLSSAENGRKELKNFIDRATGLLQAKLRFTKAKFIRAYTKEKSVSGQITDLTGRAEEVFLDTFRHIIPPGDYYKKGETIKLIAERIPKNRERRKMLWLLELIPKKKSLWLAMKTMNEPQSFEIEAFVLQRAISKTLFATGNDELRPNMMGVLCELSNENITFVATDAHKLVRYTNNAVKVDDTASFILPKKPITQLKSTLSGVNDKVKVEYTADTHHIRFSFANIVLFSSLKEGKFPAYQAVIPKDNPNKFVVDRKDFHKSICRVGIYSNQSTFQVRISLSDEKKVVTAEDLDFSNKAEEVIKGSYIGETMDIGFNSKFLREMLENLDSETISLEMSQPNRAALIVPTEQDSPDEDLLMLIMPVMLNY